MKTVTTDNNGGWVSDKVVGRFDPEFKKKLTYPKKVKRNYLKPDEEWAWVMDVSLYEFWQE